MPKRKEHLADGVQDAIAKRRKTSKLLDERLKVPTEDSSPIDATVAPDPISSLHGKKRTPIATGIAEIATNTAVTALPDVATSLPPADVDADDDVNANTDSVKDTQSNTDPRATDPSTSTNTQEIKLEPVVKTEIAPAPTNPSTSTQQIKLEPVVKTETAPAPANPSTSTQEIKLEPVVKTETAPAPPSAPTNTSNDQAEAPIPTEPVISGPNLHRTVTVHRKVAKRTEPLYLAPPPQNIAAPLLPSPQAEEIPARKKPRVEEPLPTIIDEAARKTASPATHPSTDAVNTWTRRRSRRRVQLPSMETSETQPDDADGPNTPPEATVNAPTRRRRSRRVIPTSSTGSPVPPPSTATVNVSTRCQSQRQTQLPPIEMSETQLDDSDEFAEADDGDGDLPRPFWKARLRELADYRKIHGHCNVPRSYSENSKLANWVKRQRSNYKLHLEGEKSHMTLSHIQELEGFGFEWDTNGAAWEDRLSELAVYRKIYGHCNVPRSYSENSKLAKWVRKQRSNYSQRVKGKNSSMTLSRIQILESLGFEWDSHAAAWEDRLSELADYRKIHGHCNVPKSYSENSKLANWVKRQRSNYKLHLEGEKSHMTLSHIQELEGFGFEWDTNGAAWEDRLSELADYRKIYGHCNVPQNYSENSKLANWVKKQRNNYKLYRDGKRSSMTLSRIQILEGFGFEWDSRGTTWDDRLSELADYRRIHGHCNVPQRYSENSKLAHWVSYQRNQYKLHLEKKASHMTLSRIQALESLGFEWDSRGNTWEDRLSELADYRKLHGHCNVPRKYVENSKLGWWVSKQRQQYKLHLQGNTSYMTLSRVQALERLGFE